jgi:phosphohistidine phosphatase
MKTIIILRHGKSSWSDSNLADHDRPLKTRGKEAARRIGRSLEEEGIMPDLIYSSTAKRARDTVRYLLETMPCDSDVIFSRDLYPGSPDDYIEILKMLKNDIQCVMVVGHNPGLEELLFYLTNTVESLPTAAAAQVDLEINEWREIDDLIQGKLVNLWLPHNLL